MSQSNSSDQQQTLTDPVNGNKQQSDEQQLAGSGNNNSNRLDIKEEDDGIKTENIGDKDTKKEISHNDALECSKTEEVKLQSEKSAGAISTVSDVKDETKPVIVTGIEDADFRKSRNGSKVIASSKNGKSEKINNVADAGHNNGCSTTTSGSHNGISKEPVGNNGHQKTASVNGLGNNEANEQGNANPVLQQQQSVVTTREGTTTNTATAANTLLISGDLNNQEADVSKIAFADVTLDFQQRDSTDLDSSLEQENDGDSLLLRKNHQPRFSMTNVSEGYLHQACEDPEDASMYTAVQSGNVMIQSGSLENQQLVNQSPTFSIPAKHMNTLQLPHIPPTVSEHTVSIAKSIAHDYLKALTSSGASHLDQLNSTVSTSKLMSLVSQLTEQVQAQQQSPLVESRNMVEQVMAGKTMNQQRAVSSNGQMNGDAPGPSSMLQAVLSNPEDRSFIQGHDESLGTTAGKEIFQTFCYKLAKKKVFLKH